MKKYNICVAPAANDRMVGHFEFLARVSENAAYKLLDELIEDIKLLETNPQINPYLDRPYIELGKYRYKLSYGRYRIVYQIVNDTVFVDDIQDCRQDDDKSLLK
jgi:mRNA-degrading endonuclease RelE of RelBE toxin-antitoxin system